MLAYLRDLYGRLRDAWPPNRFVVAATPLISMVSGAAAMWLAQHFPGLPTIDPGFITGFGATVALSAFLQLRKFLDGWIQYEAQVADGQTPLPTPAEKRKRRKSAKDNMSDPAMALSQPSDIAESDATDELEADEQEIENPQ